MKAILVTVLLMWAICWSACYAQKEALLIANADYEHFAKLPNPIPDSKLLGDVLKRAGYHVKILENAKRESMLLELKSFEQRIKENSGVAFFHYGGHGVQVGGKNYLIPVDSEIPDEIRVVTRALDLDEIMSCLTASGSTANVVVIDACRDNPLPTSSTRSATRGLSVISRKPKNSVIIYSAEAGSTAIDGLFTPILSKKIDSSGNTDISEVMKLVRKDVYLKSEGLQTPGEYNQLFERLSFFEMPSDPLKKEPQQKIQENQKVNGDHTERDHANGIEIIKNLPLKSATASWSDLEKDGLTKEMETVIDGRKTIVRIGLDSPNGTKSRVCMEGLDFAWNLNLSTNEKEGPFNEYGDFPIGWKYTVTAYDFDSDGSAELIFHISEIGCGYVWIFKSIKNQPYTIDKAPFELILHKSHIQDKIILDKNTINIPIGYQGLFIGYEFIGDKFLHIKGTLE